MFNFSKENEKIKILINKNENNNIINIELIFSNNSNNEYFCNFKFLDMITYFPNPESFLKFLIYFLKSWEEKKTNILDFDVSSGGYKINFDDKIKKTLTERSVLKEEKEINEISKLVEEFKDLKKRVEVLENIVKL